MNVVKINRDAWDKQSREGGEWSVPVTSETLEKAKNNDWQVILTPMATVPKAWFGELNQKQLLGLASGGGQQMPILAAAGASVTSFDNSDEQLAKDQLVAQRDGLLITTHQGDMADLSIFADEQFDLIFHPVSNCFVPDVCKVWQECFRVLKPGGRLLAGFMNPAMFMFDHDKSEQTGKLEVERAIPYADIEAGEVHKKALIDKGQPFEFSHTLDTQISGQIAAGFTLGGFYEDKWTDEALLLNKYMSTSMATLAIKPQQ
jgi:SAM-dependent methyltransferase